MSGDGLSVLLTGSSVCISLLVFAVSTVLHFTSTIFVPLSYTGIMFSVPSFIAFAISVYVAVSHILVRLSSIIAKSD